MYGFRKADRVKPAVTVTIYVGLEHWDGPLRLSDIVEEGSEYVKWASVFRQMPFIIITANKISGETIRIHDR